MIIDAKTGEQTGTDPFGASALIKWSELVKLLQSQQKDTITHLVIQESGITTRLSKAK